MTTSHRVCNAVLRDRRFGVRPTELTVPPYRRVRPVVPGHEPARPHPAAPAGPAGVQSEAGRRLPAADRTARSDACWTPRRGRRIRPGARVRRAAADRGHHRPARDPGRRRGRVRPATAPRSAARSTASSSLSHAARLHGRERQLRRCSRTCSSCGAATPADDVSAAWSRPRATRCGRRRCCRCACCCWSPASRRPST